MFSTPNPDFRAVIAQKLERNQFSKTIGFQMDRVDPGATNGHITLDNHHHQQNGFAHGGVLLTLCDIVAGFAAFTLVPAKYHVVTAEIKVSCLRPATGTRLEASGWVLKPGRKLHFCESEVWAVDDGTRILVAKSSSTMAVVPPDGFRTTKK